jgi:Protein of unknown function (DUF664)
MNVAGLLEDAFDRIAEIVHEAVEGLTPYQLALRIDPDANSVAWLVWHLTRVQDDHVAGVAGRAQVWTDGWEERFGLPLPASSLGYGHTSEQVAAVKAPGDLLVAYYDAVHEQTKGFIAGLVDDDLDRVVDTRWHPPVTLGVRLVSVISDDLQHAGQAAYVRGVVLRTT